MHDRLCGLVAASLGAAVFWTALSFPKLGSGYPGPGLFPQILGMLLFGFGTFLAVRGWHHSTGSTLRTLLPRREWLNAVVVIGAVFAYLLAVSRLGFSLTMAPILTAVMLSQRVPLRRAVPFATLAVLAIYILFARLLRVPLPAGPWGW